MIKRVTKDFETRSMVDLKSAGAYKYSLDPSTQPTCLAFKVRGEKMVYFLPFETVNTPWEKLPIKLRKMWQHYIDEGYEMSAHNSFFERCIYDNIMVARYGWPAISPELRRCTAAKAAACALPRNLAGAGEAMRLTVQKDWRGHQAVMATCKPTKQWKAWKTAQDKVFSSERYTQKTLALASLPEPSPFLPAMTMDEIERVVKQGPLKKDDPTYRNALIWQTLYIYCKIDVRTEEELDESLPDLIPQEQEIWHLNQKLNWRGLKVDIPTVEKIVGIMELESKKKIKELDSLTMGLVTKPGARNSILEFLALDGIVLPDLRAKTVDDALRGFMLSEDMQALLEIRKALSKTSTKKYLSFLNRAHIDDRVRDLTMYHGASTGRDTGTGIQPHNFPRGVITVTKDRPYAAVENVIECDEDMLRILYGDSLSMLFSSILRNMIIPTKGKELFVADFSKIEVAVLWWLAGNEEGLRILRSGKDPYIYQAANNLNMTYDAFEAALNSEEPWAFDSRQLGKAQILGCFDKNTKVLTDSGWKRIADVGIKDKIWDGIEWVSHQGVLYQGMKPTVLLFGVTLTPDHLLLSRQGWVSAEAVLKGNEEFRKSVLDLADLPSSGIGSALEEDWLLSKYSATAKGIHTKSMTTTYLRAKVLNVIVVLKKLLITGLKNITVMKTLCLIRATEPVYLTGYPQRSGDALEILIPILSTTAGVGLKFATFGEKIKNIFYTTFKPYFIGTDLILKWTELIMTVIMSPVTFVLYLALRICSTVEVLVNSKIEYNNSNHVYDIVHAGPRNRFTIMSDRGPLIAHNCGFGMGPDKFQLTAWEQYRLKLTLKESRIAVKNYRESNDAVPELWREYEEAAIRVVRDKIVVTAGKCKFYYKDSFLWVELPSGRALAYKDPEIVWRQREYEVSEIEMVNGEEVITKTKKISEPQETLEFYAVNSKTKKWCLERTWGGTLTENFVQGTARDLMMPAMVRLEKAGYHALLSVHDEGLCEKEIGKGSLDEFTKILCMQPKWAPGLPIEAKGWKGPRYRK